jgi:hypothetical protein
VLFFELFPLFLTIVAALIVVVLLIADRSSGRADDG